MGARGVGEASIIPPLPAVANAIYDAIGVRMNKLPMNPGAIMETSGGNKGTKARLRKSRQESDFYCPALLVGGAFKSFLDRGQGKLVGW